MTANTRSAAESLVAFRLAQVRRGRFTNPEVGIKQAEIKAARLRLRNGLEREAEPNVGAGGTAKYEGTHSRGLGEPRLHFST
jgi:hypothetical protein